MKIDFSQVLKEHTGGGMKQTGGKEFTLGHACVTALDALTEESGKIGGEEKHRRGALADKIYRTKEPISLSVEDVALIKGIIGKIFGPHVVYEAWNLLDPPGKSEEEVPKI
jgi:hypothetical protein